MGLVESSRNHARIQDQLNYTTAADNAFNTRSYESNKGETVRKYRCKRLDR